MDDSEREQDELERIRKAAEGGSSRSPLYLWLWRHHDRFADIVSVTRPNWNRLAAEFGELGFKNELGGVLTGAVVRQTWVRVRKRYAEVNSARVSGRDRRQSTPTLPPVVRPVSGGASPLPRPVVSLTRLAGSTKEQG